MPPSPAARFAERHADCDMSSTPTYLPPILLHIHMTISISISRHDQTPPIYITCFQLPNISWHFHFCWQLHLVATSLWPSRSHLVNSLTSRLAECARCPSQKIAFLLSISVSAPVYRLLLIALASTMTDRGCKRTESKTTNSSHHNPSNRSCTMSFVFVRAGLRIPLAVTHVRGGRANHPKACKKHRESIASVC
jgi:hypothetical protein